MQTQDVKAETVSRAELLDLDLFSEEVMNISHSDGQVTRRAKLKMNDL